VNPEFAEAVAGRFGLVYGALRGGGNFAKDVFWGVLPYAMISFSVAMISPAESHSRSLMTLPPSNCDSRGQYV